MRKTQNAEAIIPFVSIFVILQILTQELKLFQIAKMISFESTDPVKK